MLGFLKKLVRRPSATSADESAMSTSQPAPAPAPIYSSAPTKVFFDGPQPQPRKTAPPPVRHNGKGMEISLQKILSSLPLELQPRVVQADVGDVTLSVPLEKVLAQLSRGVVRISFGELRQAVPEVFTLENDRDRVLVQLPLEDILSNLNPALIARRRVQRQVEVPSEISSPFDVESQALVFDGGAGESEPEPTPAPFPPRHSALTSSPPAAPSHPVAPSHHTTLTPPAAPPPSPVIRPRFSPAVPSNQPPAQAPLKPQAFAPAPPPPQLKPQAFAPAPPPPPPAAPVNPMAPPSARKPAPEPRLPSPETQVPIAPAIPPGPGVLRDFHSAPPAPAPAQFAAPTRPAHEPEPLLVALMSLAEAWPEPVRKEIVDLKLVEAKVALPTSAVEQALKQGRIAFSWKTLRSWIKPAVLPAVSAHDGAVLELPLKIVAPLFLARQRSAAKAPQKVAVDEEIPNLFFGFPQPEQAVSPAAATARPADTNYYVWNDSADTVHVHESDVKRGPSPGTKFVAKYATPNEVVSRAGGLEGVAGALIALPDGLMVASHLSPDLNGDTLAAFLPQIFGKVSQCTKELRMGDLNNLNFTVGNVPWKIFRVNAIFFAAFGRAGEPLPTAQLAALAAELDHKPK